MKKILIVEDEPKHQKTMIDYLVSENGDYEIISANTGKSACTIAETELPDLIIMDWELPVMNGIESTRQLKSTEKTSAIPIIMCTGVMMTSHDLQTAFNAGAIDFIRKPVDRIELTARVHSMLKLTEYYNAKNLAEKKIIDLTNEIQEREIKRMKADIDFKNKELTSKALFLVQKDELLLKTIETLQNINKQGNSETSKQIALLINELQISTRDERWREFEVHFEQVHEEFYVRLKAKYPELTANEKKLCAFIRLNLSTKEICALTQQTLKSVEVARTRLRQKLNLSQNENLASFISNI